MGTLTYTPNAGFDGADSFDYTVGDGTDSDTGTVNITVDPAGSSPVIDVWYGPEQTFGSPGEAQRWVNILGTTSADVVSLSYSLNGGPDRALSLGPDTHRLQDPGDFNVDLDYTELDGSSIDDVVTIKATLDTGEVVTSDVTIDYESGSRYSPNYSIDWSNVSNIQDVVQVSDGLWSLEADGVRPTQEAYDQLLVLGDEYWDNYEVNLQITPHSLPPDAPQQPGVAFGMLWDGHTDEPFRTEQPKAGWIPGTAFFYRNALGGFKLHDYANFAKKAGTGAFTLVEGERFNVKIRLEQENVFDRTLSAESLGRW